MEIVELKTRDFDQNKKLTNAYVQLGKLLNELKKTSLPEGISTFINQQIDQLNAITGSENELKKHLGSIQSRILKLLGKELKIVTKNYYRNTWMIMGMAVFGIPLGTTLGVSLGNMGFIGVGLPLGMAIGIAIGSQMDKKAALEGRVLDIEIKQ